VSKLLAVVLLGAMGASALGYGAAVRRLARAPGGAAIDAGVGLGALIFVGGVLNLARLARAPALWLVLAAGVAMAVLRFRGARPPELRQPGARLELGIAAIVIAALALFAVATQLPPAAFNVHDDLQKYFVHPVRMLALGTVGGNPLGAIGSETLGGLAFLHGFVLAALPLPYVNGVDAVLGLVLLALLGAAAGWGRLRPLPGAAVAPLAIALVNPQYINVSALYLGAALVATACLLSVEARTELPPPLPLGLVYAAAIAVKPTLLLFVALHAAACALAAASAAGARRAAAWGARIALWTAASVAPWLAVAALGPPETATLDAGAAPPGVVHPLSSLFTLRPLFYGATAAHYLALVGVALIGAVAAARSLRGPGDADRRRLASALLAALSAGVLSFVVMVPVLGAAVAGFGHGIRYAIPILLGAVVVPLPALGALRTPGGAPARLPRLAAGALLAVALAFLPSWADRCEQALRAGSILAFPRLARSEPFLAFNREALSERSGERVRRVQALVPAGEPMVVWITTPHHVDQRRNPAYTVEVGFAGRDAAGVPADARYVLWQYAGYGVRTPEEIEEQLRGAGAQERLRWARTRAFLRSLERLSTTAPRLYDDGELALLPIPR
jgi:hypothetical protein